MFPKAVYMGDAIDGGTVTYYTLLLHLPINPEEVKPFWPIFTLPWHAPMARSRGTLPPRARARAPAGTTCHQARNLKGKHIYQRATVKHLKMHLLSKIKQNGQRL